MALKMFPYHGFPQDRRCTIVKEIREVYVNRAVRQARFTRAEKDLLEMLLLATQLSAVVQAGASIIV